MPGETKRELTEKLTPRQWISELQPGCLRQVFHFFKTTLNADDKAAVLSAEAESGMVREKGVGQFAYVTESDTTEAPRAGVVTSEIDVLPGFDMMLTTVEAVDLEGRLGWWRSGYGAIHISPGNVLLWHGVV